MTTTTWHLHGCGFGFWNAWGILEQRNPRRDVILEGVSGSALACVAYACHLDVDVQLAVCELLRPDMLRFGRVYATLRKWLECALPPNCVELCHRRNVHIVVRHLPSCRTVRVHRFRSRAHLIDTLLVSCSWFPKWYEGGWYIDAMVTWSNPSAQRISVTIVPYIPSRSVALQLYQNGLSSGHP